MDPATALSTASCIVQFLDFSIRVVSKGNKIYHSINGNPAEDLDLELITNDLLLMQTKLQRSTQALGLSNPVEEDARALDALSIACAGAAERLLKKLNMAKAQGRFRRLKGLRQALKSVWSKAEVEEMARVLHGFRSELQLRILVSLKDQIDLHALDRTERTASLDGTALQILQALKENKDLYSTSMQAQSNFLSNKLGDLSALMHETGHQIKKTVNIVNDDLQRLHRVNQVGGVEEDIPISLRKEYAISAIIASLAFPGMDDRYEAVVEAHAQTFSWIFNAEEPAKQSWDDFTGWLESTENLYWINGKAASGKSTLMRYIFRHEATHNYLETWAGHEQLMIPKFYFWSLGSPIQKSQMGLFRSLLYQIFDANWNLVNEVLPQLVHETSSLRMSILGVLENRNKWRNWTLKELEQVFWTLVNRDDLSVHYCFFIDGLDEFDGDFLELDFEQQFGDVPKLRLQNLTVGDISLYVRDKLGDHPQFKTYTIEEPSESRDLIEEIISKSSGVFLWVTLVVRSLLKRLTNRDTLADLQKRLRKTPDELDDLYSHMLASIRPPFYLEQASRLLQLVYQLDRPMTAACLAFADDNDTDLVFKRGFGSVASSELLRRTEAITHKLRSRCVGLLEVSGTPNCESAEACRVQYLHLTVKEYLEKPRVWSGLLALTQSSGFDANVSLFRSSILLLKSQIPSPSATWNKDLWVEIEASMALAVGAEHSSGLAQPELLRVFDQTVSELWFARRDNVSMVLHWAADLHSPDQRCLRCPNSFLEYATSRGLTLYVKNELDMLSQHPQTRNSTPCLLDYATWHVPWYVNEPIVQPAMVAMLFKAGCHPDENLAGSTPWKNLLVYMARAAKVWERLNMSNITDLEYTKFDSSWLDVCSLFIMSGADLYTSQWDRARRQNIFAWQILAMTFEHLPSPPVLELQRLFEERGVDTSDGRGSQKHPHWRTVSEPESTEPRRHGSPTGFRDPYVSSTSHVRASYRNDGSLRQFEYQTEYPKSWSGEGLDTPRYNSRQRTKTRPASSREQYRKYRDDGEYSWRQQPSPHLREQRQDSHRTKYKRQDRPFSYWEGERQRDYPDNRDTERHPAPFWEKQSQYDRPDKHGERRHQPPCWYDYRRRWRPY